MVSWTLQSRENGYVFKLVGRNDEFILLQVDRRRGWWDTPVIRNYFGFLAFVLNETVPAAVPSSWASTAEWSHDDFNGSVINFFFFTFIMSCERL